MAQVVIGNWGVHVLKGKLPLSYDRYVGRARLAEEFDLKAPGGGLFFVAVETFEPAEHEEGKPLLTVAQRFSPYYESGFDPGVLIVPETSRLFIGAGERLLAYDLRSPARLWEDHADCGFSGWGRYGNFVWMAAEIEFAVWSIDGTKLWSTFVDPPWHSQFDDGGVTLHAFDQTRTLRIADGTPVT